MNGAWGWFFTGAFLASGITMLVAGVCLWWQRNREVMSGGFDHRGKRYRVSREREPETQSDIHLTTISAAWCETEGSHS